jgi:hypothetical protein
MNFPYREKLIALSAARYAAKAAVGALQMLIAGLKEGHTYKAIEEKLIANTALVKSLEEEIKTAIVNDFQAGNKKPDKYVGTRHTPASVTLEYDYNATFDWASKHLPEAIVLDKDLFEKHALAVAKTQPIPGVTIVTTPGQPYGCIASDLGELLPLEEPKQEDIPETEKAE